MGAHYKRVLIKLSGGALAGPDHVGFNAQALEHIAREVLSVKDLGIEVAIVIGGGNIFRGDIAKDWRIERAEADNIGVLGTIINSIMLRGVIKARSENVEVRLMSAVRIDAIAEPFIRLRAVHHLEKGYIVIFGGGTGQPFMTTDYPAVQRAIEVGCDAILVAKHGVDGVYDADPKKSPDARRYARLGYNEIVQKNLKVMDQSALILARDYSMPLHVFNFDEQGFFKRICQGERDLGTFIGPVESAWSTPAPAR